MSDIERYIYDQEPNEPVERQPNFDHLFRIKEISDPSSSYEVSHLAHTETFTFKMHSLLQENRVLKDAVSTLWKTHQYNQEYIAYLIGTYSKEEFKTIAEQYADPIQECEDQTHLTIAIDILLSTLGSTLSTLDLSILLNFSPSCIESNIKQIEYRPEDNQRV